LLPDHGEVWALPWRLLSQSDESLELQVDGVALPYKLRRELRLRDAKTLDMRYTLENVGPEPFIYLWAAHPLFVVDHKSRIELPQHIHDAISIHHPHPEIRQGDRLPWAVTDTASDSAHAVNHIGHIYSGFSQKYAIAPDTVIDAAALLQLDKNCQIRLSWSFDELPYLAVWVDNAAYAASPNIALEPMSGYYDSLPIALSNNRVSRVDAGRTMEWSLTVAIDDIALLDQTHS
jgi:galactose mutarotase-like enzyme